MKSKLCFLFLLSILLFNVDALFAQKSWQKVQKAAYLVQKKEIYQKKNFPANYEIASLDLNSFSSNLKSNTAKQSKVIELPNTDGTYAKFSVKETSNFDAELQAKFPNIKSYSAQGIDDPTAVAKISIGTDGFHAVIFSGKQETIYIDPYSKNNKDYIIYKRSSLSAIDNDFKCQLEASAKEGFSVNDFSKNANDGKLRTFRLALACSGEYAQFHLGASQQNVPTTATEQVKKAAVLSAMNTSITRINGIFEKDLAVKLVLVGNNDSIIFLDAATDNITDGTPDTMINQVQTICDGSIGEANYDIGHLFSVGGDGLAGLGVVCVSGQKARGVTGRSQPVGDPYDIDFVVHELGHQFGATHTQNNDCNRTSSTAVEPGSASTIMGYAGICAPNVQSGNPNGNSDDYFHAVSIAQMWAVIQSSGTCAAITATNNSAPTANAGVDFSIPKSTPFKLKGTATDANGLASLTYNWEQLDKETATMPPLSANSGGPMFRSLPSKTVPERYMPALATVIAGSTSSIWEVVPSVARSLNFSFLVRDNNAGGGSTARDDMKVEVTDAAAFTVTSLSTNETLSSGQTITINWNKGTTDLVPIDCESVNIRLSIDGGITFPIVLKTNTPNDGSENIIVPDNPTSNARIMVEAADNIFYNVNASKFTIISSTPTFLIKDVTGEQSICNTSNQSVSFSLDFDFINGFTETATLSATGNPTGSTIVFNPTTINADGTVTLTISDLQNKEAKSYDINVVGTSATVTQNINLVLKVRSATFNELVLSSPIKSATNVSLTETLTWVNDENASSYFIEIASDPNFTTIVSSATVDVNSYTATNLVGETEYFWQVKAKNDCGEGDFSATFNFITENPLYCLSTFTDESGGTEHITNVTFSGINNTSNNDTVDGYQDFTSINAYVFKGQTKQISVTINTGGFQDHCYVFIDWNQDFIFDITSERYDLGTILDDVGTASFNITVPDNAKFGQTTMRVIIEYDDPTDGYGLGPCDADHFTEWGETEDYSVTVVEPIIKPENFSVQTVSETCVDENDGIINIDINQPEFTYQVTITGASANVVQNISGTTYSLSNLNPGDYEVCILAKELNYTQCFEVKIEESQPVSLKVASKNANTYSFNIDAGTAPYHVYLNEELISISDEKQFDLEIKGSGKLEVKTAKECEGFYKTSIGQVTLKQNPVKETIELLLPINNEQTTINAIIFDVNGKMIYNQLLKKVDNSLSIPFSDYAKGVYILKLSIESTKPIKILK